MSINFKAGVSEMEIQSLRESANASVISRSEFSGAVTEKWQVVGKTIDSLEVALEHDSRVDWAEPNRILLPGTQVVTTVRVQDAVAKNFMLHQNYPNPFNPSTTIEFNLPAREFVSVKIFDMLGNEIETLVNEQLNAGTYRVNWNAAARAAGVYFYRLKTGGNIETKKLILLK